MTFPYRFHEVGKRLTAEAGDEGLAQTRPLFLAWSDCADIVPAILMTIEKMHIGWYPDGRPFGSLARYQRDVFGLQSPLHRYLRLENRHKISPSAFLKVSAVEHERFSAVLLKVHRLRRPHLCPKNQIEVISLM